MAESNWCPKLLSQLATQFTLKLTVKFKFNLSDQVRVISASLSSKYRANSMSSGLVFLHVLSNCVIKFVFTLSDQV